MEILTEKGFKEFDGFIDQGERDDLIELKLSNNEKIKTTPEHKILDEKMNYIRSDEVKENDIIYNNVKILKKNSIYTKEKVYDALNVKDTNSYYTNGIVSHNCLILDELAFVDPQWKAEQFWASNYPTISSSETSKVIIISTPNGLYNLFHRLYSKAEKRRNEFVPTFYDYRAVPGRDEEWKRKQIDNLGSEILFNQEFGCQFLGSSYTVISANKLRELLDNNISSPTHIDLGGSFRIYEKPKESYSYLIGVDTSKGSGEHYSTIQVLRMDSINPVKLEQVAVFEDNMTEPYRFAEIINRICYYYNGAYLMIENNAEGSTVVSQLHWGYENECLINTGSKTVDLGIRANKNTKPKAVMLMKKFIEENMLILNDERTIHQLTDFQDKGNNRYACINMNDDLVSALYWACYIFEMDILDESMSFKNKAKEDEEEDIWGILSDVELPEIEEDWSWL